MNSKVWWYVERSGGIVAWEYSNSDAFCTNMCHAVHPEEPKAHAASLHASET